MLRGMQVRQSRQESLVDANSRKSEVHGAVGLDAVDDVKCRACHLGCGLIVSIEKIERSGDAMSKDRIRTFLQTIDGEVEQVVLSLWLLDLHIGALLLFFDLMEVLLVLNEQQVGSKRFGAA